MQVNKQTYKQTVWLANLEADGKTDRQEDGQMHSQTGMQTNRQSIRLSGGQAEIQQG
jgi:hypothetical protein